MGVVGLIVSVGFIYRSAPDLALTQISVEVVSVILLLLALNFLPKETPVESSSLRRLRDAALAGISGVRVTGLIYLVMTRDFPSISAYHLAPSTPAGRGTTVVNVVLVASAGSATFSELILIRIALRPRYALPTGTLPGPSSTTP